MPRAARRPGRCTHIADLHLSEGLESLAGAAFRKCTALESLVLPSSLTAIGGDDYYAGAFDGCTRLPPPRKPKP